MVSGLGELRCYCVTFYDILSYYSYYYCLLQIIISSWPYCQFFVSICVLHNYSIYFTVLCNFTTCSITFPSEVFHNHIYTYCAWLYIRCMWVWSCIWCGVWTHARECMYVKPSSQSCPLVSPGSLFLDSMLSISPSGWVVLLWSLNWILGQVHSIPNSSYLPLQCLVLVPHNEHYE